MNTTVLLDKFNNVTELIKHSSMKEANDLLEEIVRSSSFREFVLADAKNPFDPFLLNFLSRYQVYVCDNSESFTVEADSVALYSKDRYLKCIHDLDSFIGMMLHVYMHDYCREQWPHAALNKDVLDILELDFVEEFFGYIVLRHDFHTFHENFFALIVKSMDYFELETDKHFYDHIGLFGNHTTPLANLEKIKTWLLGEKNFKSPGTFRAYIKMMYLMRDLPEYTASVSFRKTIDKSQNRLKAIEASK